MRRSSSEARALGERCLYLDAMGFHPDMGTVPAWLGAGSLLLAFRIFLRDRSRSDRAQVDGVGVWGVIQRGGGDRPGRTLHDEVKVRIVIRNATDLPIEVHQVAFTFQTKWVVAPTDVDDIAVRALGGTTGKTDMLRFMGPTGIAPRETTDGSWVTVNLARLAPVDGARLSIYSDGVKCVIMHALIVDNAGRRWEARQKQGKSAKRIRWYSRPGKSYPMEWQSPAWRKIRIFNAYVRISSAYVKARALNITNRSAT
jgi:hypothetical protein